MEVGKNNNFKEYLSMVNQTLEAGRLVSRAISEVKSSHRGMSMTQVLIDAGLVGSDSALS